MDYYPLAYKVAGGLFSVQALFFILISVLAGTLPSMPAYLMVSMAVMSFSMAYLHPQFKQKDERMQLIRYKGLFYSFFAMLIYMFALLTLLEAGVNLTASMVIQMLIALNICTVFLSWVILSKKM
ncbi:UNVERIFIED_CONTAM: permease [Halobacillus marinus]|uniref:hypothetical protein n=1 Tax=Bacillaceae TaxID=186817 RepID=UPI0002A50A63|nr:MULTISPECIES: hypothetical protein [Bacillaceae]ELK44713.1 hypothetical protein D479_18329 [Halobacillus sp. BAB-2008]